MDARRDAAFTFAYLADAVGAVLAPLVALSIGRALGWSYGFGLGAMGVGFGMAIFLLNQRLLGRRSGLQPAGHQTARVGLALGSAVAAMALALVLMSAPAWLPGARAALVGAVVAIAVAVGLRAGPEGRWREVAAAAVMAAALAWAAVAEQVGRAFASFVPDNVAAPTGGFGGAVIEVLVAGPQAGTAVQAPVIASGAPFLVLVLAPLFAVLLQRRGRGGPLPSGLARVGAGLVLFGAALAVIVAGARLDDADGRLPLAVFAVAVTLWAGSELLVAPIALATVARLAPRGRAGAAVGALTVVTSLAPRVAAALAAGAGSGSAPSDLPATARLAALSLVGGLDVVGSAGGVASLATDGVAAAGLARHHLPPMSTLPLHADAFAMLAVGVTVAGAIVLLIAPPLSRRSGGLA